MGKREGSKDAYEVVSKPEPQKRQGAATHIF